MALKITRKIGIEAKLQVNESLRGIQNPIMKGHGTKTKIKIITKSGKTYSS